MYLKFIARVKFFAFGVLRLFFRFERWHLSPLESRPYARDIVDHINSENLTFRVVEVGCGLGEIISATKANFRTGLDTSDRVISAAKFLHFHKQIDFKIGTFEDIEGHEIDYLILVNFTHSISPSKLKISLNKVSELNFVKHLIVDEVTLEGYQFHHNFDNLVPSNYKLSKTFPENYSYSRIIKIYSRGI